MRLPRRWPALPALPALAARAALAALLLALVAAPAAALTLQVDHLRSAITPRDGGAAETLTGSLEVTLGAEPVLANTTFDVVGLGLTASGGATIGLDPAAPSPGLGVITPAGEVLIGTLFLRIVDGASAFLLALPDVAGQATFAPDGSLVEIATAFALDTPSDGILDVTLAATVPEPTTAALLGAALAFGLALAARRGLQPRELR